MYNCIVISSLISPKSMILYLAPFCRTAFWKMICAWTGYVTYGTFLHENSIKVVYAYKCQVSHGTFLHSYKHVSLFILDPFDEK
jgi:hypothetical protein